MVLLSFSLRFCSVFKMHYKTRLKVKSLPEKRDSLHTCSNVFLKSILKKRLWLEHLSKVCSRLALLLRFYSVFCVGADFGSLGLFGRIFGDFFRDFIAIVKNCVRETAVRVHIGAQNCGKNAIFQTRLDKYSVFRNSSACLCTWFFTVSLGFHSELCVSSTSLGFDIRLTQFRYFRGGRF